jgi:ribonuclease P protein component
LISQFSRKRATENFLLIKCDRGKLAAVQNILCDDVCYYAIKASKKIGNAVLRNKIKRRVRHILTNIAKDLPQVKQTAFIIVPKKTCAIVNFANLQQEFAKNMLDGNNNNKIVTKID